MQKQYLFFVLYLFSYYQISPAIEFTVAKQLQENSTALIGEYGEEINGTALIKYDHGEHHREKRWLLSLFIAVAAGIISGTISQLLGEQIGKLINGHRLRRSYSRVELINSRLNLNYYNAVALKRKITSLNPSVGNALMVNSQGYRCDAAFCAGKDTGHYALGLCSKYMCYCDAGTPGPLECGGGLVYDPTGKYCNNPTNMALCGY